jgi:hypothetical protein
MSIGPLEHAGIAAGTPSALSKGSELHRAAHDSAQHARHVEAGRRAEDAAGIGATRGDENETSDRDADGRRLWEVSLGEAPRSIDADGPGGGGAKDPTGQSGTQLDLAG